MTRKGPHPLSVQIGLAASAPDMQADAAEENLLRKPSSLTVDMEKMLLGIQKYQNHPFEAERLPLETVWEAGTASVQSIPGYAAKKEAPVMLLVPSMINRGYILDLMEGRSLLRWLGGQGITPCLFDWGEGVQDPGQQSIDDIILQRLVPAIEFVAQKSGQKINVLGYCMGGTLLAGAAQFAAPSIRSLVFLAAPWDFHAGTKNILGRVKFWAPTAFPAIAEKGHLPMDWMQILFASIDPKSAAKKFGSFLDMEAGSEEEKLFIAVEDWLNDGVDLPGAVAQNCIKEWFFENAPAAQKWHVGGEVIDPAQIAMPVLVIASKRDRLVDYETATAIACNIRHARVMNSGTGHIGMIAGSRAVDKVWTPVAEWIKNHPPASS